MRRQHGRGCPGPVDELEPAGVDDDRQVARQGHPGRSELGVTGRLGLLGGQAGADRPRLHAPGADDGLGHGGVDEADRASASRHSAACRLRPRPQRSWSAPPPRGSPRCRPRRRARRGSTCRLRRSAPATAGRRRRSRVARRPRPCPERSRPMSMTVSRPVAASPAGNRWAGLAVEKVTVSSAQTASSSPVSPEGSSPLATSTAITQASSSMASTRRAAAGCSPGRPPMPTMPSSTRSASATTCAAASSSSARRARWCRRPPPPRVPPASGRRDRRPRRPPRRRR